MPVFNNNQVDAKAPVDRSFFTVAPGVYPAVVRKIEDRPEFWGAYPGGFTNANHPQGHWQWVKIVPHIELLNADHTLVNRQDMTIGIFDNGNFVAPNPKNSPIFTGWFRGKLGAGTLLAALGLMVYGDNGATLRGDTSKIVDAVVNVRTAVGLYNSTKVNADKKNYGPDETLELLKEQNGGEIPAFAQYRDLLTAYNAAHGLEGDDALKMKNFIVDVQALSDAEVKAGGYTKDALGTVYLTAASAKVATSAPAAPGSVAGW